MSNVLSVWSWLAAVVCVCKLCHASDDGRQKTAWGVPLEGKNQPACSVGSFHISIEAGDGLCTARWASLSHLSGDAAEKWGGSPTWLWPYWGPFCTRQNCCSEHLAWDLGLAALQEQIYWWGLSEPLSFLSINTIQHMGAVIGWHVKLCSCPSAAVSSFETLLM